MTINGNVIFVIIIINIIIISYACIQQSFLQESDFLFLTITKQTTIIMTTIPPDNTAATIPAFKTSNVFSQIDFV